MREHNILVLILSYCREAQGPDLSEGVELPVFFVFVFLVCKGSSEVLAGR